MYCELHNHTHYSIRDGFSTPEEVAQRCKEINMPACAITDHGYMHGVVPFYLALKENNIKPIIGCEIYMPFKLGRGSAHLTLLAKNETGYANLVKIVSQGAKNRKKGKFSRPAVEEEFVYENKEGIIALSGCIGGHVGKYFISNNLDLAKKHFQDLHENFGEDFYGEVMIHLYPDENKEKIFHNYREFIVEQAEKRGVKVVATGDSHFAFPKHAKLHKYFLLSFDENYDYDKAYSNDFYIKSYNDMIYRGHDIEHVENSLEVANKCNFEFDFGLDLTFSEDSDKILRKICYERVPDEDVYKERLEKELKLISRFGFSGYFLMLNDIVENNKDVTFGPGRGSAAGSLVAYLLGITNVDPIEYGLLFERFLNEGRLPKKIYHVKIGNSTIKLTEEEYNEYKNRIEREIGSR